MRFKLNPNIAVAISIALFIVWEGRHSGWTDMFEAMSGKLVLIGTRGTSGSDSLPSASASKSGSGGTSSAPQSAGQKYYNSLGVGGPSSFKA